MKFNEIHITQEGGESKLVYWRRSEIDDKEVEKWEDAPTDCSIALVNGERLNLTARRIFACVEAHPVFANPPIRVVKDLPSGTQAVWILAELK